MAVYRLQRLYSDENGMGTGTKLALGALATGATLFGAKKGMLGSGIRASVNKGYMKLGNAIGSKSMVASGAKDYGIARANQFNKSLINSGKQGMSNNAIARKAVQYKNQAMGIFNPK